MGQYIGDFLYRTDNYRQGEKFYNRNIINRKRSEEKLRKIGLKEIEDIALGAALLGAGGGGDPYIGKLVAIGAVKEHGPVTLLDRTKCRMTP